jgi:isoaspartyl peptidase/L-asparaginase-like protein (Ntn-hydrolase superfamily)
MSAPVFLATWREPGKVAIDAAAEFWEQGHSLLDCLEHALVVCELDNNLMAIGRGSLPNSEGELELDAVIMDGTDLSSGAVCALRGILPAISVARLVKEETPHMMLAGDQARSFAIRNGFQPRNLLTAACIERYEQWRDNPELYSKTYIHTAEEHYGDTVTVLGREADGHVAAASSTSGTQFKMPGRVGDSPIVGAGVFADNEVGCAGATGLGEELWRALASFRAVEFMRQGRTAQEACEGVVEIMRRRCPRSLEMKCAVMAIRKDGDFGAACTVQEFPYWVYDREGIRMNLFKAENN